MSRKQHGLLDYALAILTIASPWLFAFSGQYMAPQIAVALGAALLLVSFFTDYEVGVVRTIPFAGNRLIDMLVGVALAGSFIHFAMGGRGSIVFGLLGALIIINGLFSPRPRDPSATG